MKPIIICGFPGVGKSTVAKRPDIKCSDSDSSKFDKANFPQNYINHIKNLYNNSDLEYIFVSTHKEVLEALKNEKLPFYCVIPSRDRKLEFMRLYKNRGNRRRLCRSCNQNLQLY